MFSIRLFACRRSVRGGAFGVSTPSAEPKKTADGRTERRRPTGPRTEPEGVPLELKIINTAPRPTT